MNQETKKWIDMAEMDYGVAKHLYKTMIQSHMKLFVIIVSNQRKR